MCIRDRIDSVTQMLDRGLTPEQILEEILGDFGLEITDTTESIPRSSAPPTSSLPAALSGSSTCGFMAKPFTVP